MPRNYPTSSAVQAVLTGASLPILYILLVTLLCVGPCASLHYASKALGDPAATGTVLPAPGSQNKAVEAARIQLSKSINVDIALLSVESVAPVWWSDNCLGISKPAELCDPVRTPGFRVVLAAGEYRFTYRTDLRGENVRLEELIAGPGQDLAADR